ncbi:sorbosone dehydrogenase family protein [Geothrix sp. PMB-07]|uniref:PQQ-dependent sugar dehydrogenase n=1 Tax=Geothrix sp. PMB-07 TaxID=3068640 RepID=UPI002740A5D9|nr:PQQ-dependent sugar dehydrogenase [Geothrix sp. PMB-07]WLT32801.1 PQQ-dependent sugar dehydrogenase [Geothrix sp. PMB-07]
MQNWIPILLLTCLLACGSGSKQSTPAPTPPPVTPPTGGSFHVAALVTGLAQPTALALVPDGRIFICEQGGALRVIKGGALLATPFVTVPTSIAGERGLLGVSVDPQFVQNGYVYVYYTAATPTTHNRLSRFVAAGDVAQAGSETILLELDDLSSANNHNGGALHFGPDGKLYVGVGENANGANAQSFNNLLGKLLRLNPDGSVPADNPFLSQTTGKNRLIWAMGLRNPYTFAFQPGTGRLFINDVGQNTWEEVNVGRAGANYGWPGTEGLTTDPAYASPLYAYPHSGGTVNGCSIVGADFYDPTTPAFPAAFLHQYLFMDYCGGWLRTMDPSTGTVSDWLTGFSSPVDLRVASDGSVLVLCRGGGGALQRVTYTNP